MAAFTPLQGAGGFQVGLIGGRQRPSPAREVESAAQAEASETEASSPLPETLEELEAMLEDARTKAREDATIILGDERTGLKQEREQPCESLRTSRVAASWADEVRNVLGELVVVGVRQVVGESADLQEAMLRDRFAEVGERLIGESEVVVRVRPQDEAAANALLGGDGWTVVPDADIAVAFAETDAGKVDAMGAAVAGLTEAVQTGRPKVWVRVMPRSRSAGGPHQGFDEGSTGGSGASGCGDHH